MATKKRKATTRKSTTHKPARSAPKKVPPIPAGYRAITPYLAIGGAAAAIDFYKKVFGAKERMRMEAPGGKIGHAELAIGDSVVMLADESADYDFMSPRSRGGTAVTIHMYVKDCDAVIETAVAAGAQLRRPLKDEFYGDRTATIEDPFGHVWHVSTHKEEVSKAEMRRRMAAMATA